MLHVTCCYFALVYVCLADFRIASSMMQAAEVNSLPCQKHWLLEMHGASAACIQWPVQDHKHLCLLLTAGRYISPM